MRMPNIVLGFVVATLLGACASDIKKIDLPSDMSPRDAVSETEQLREMARRSQADVLAYKDYSQGVEYLNDAQEGLDDNDDAEDILSDASYAQAYFQKAINDAQASRDQYNAILEARASAIGAGAYNYWITHEQIRDADEELRDESDNFTEVLEPKEAAHLQGLYLKAETKTVQENELGRAQAALNMLRERDADELAPVIYKTARENIMLSRNIIEQNPRDPSSYNESVFKALESVVLLQDVMDVIAENGRDTPEIAAFRIVMQNRQLGQVEDSMAALSSTVMNQADTIAFQTTMDHVRAMFNEEEAEVYQQGNKLLIRVKKMRFPVGQTEVPMRSKDLLSKINAVIMDLSPSRVEVQGHTDASGSKNANQKISQERAEKVAEFFKEAGLEAPIEAKGFGPSRPLADNSNALGRAVNRRVDIIIHASGAEDVYSE